MGSIIEKVFDGFKKITPALIAVLIFTGLILFLPQSILQKMALESIPNGWKLIAGLLFILSVTVILSVVCFRIFKHIILLQENNKFINGHIMLIRHMSPEQKRILLNLLSSEDKSIVLDSNSGNTVYLLCNRFIHQPQQIITMHEEDVMLMKYVPEGWLMDAYQNNPKVRKLLEG